MDIRIVSIKPQYLDVSYMGHEDSKVIESTIVEAEVFIDNPRIELNITVNIYDEVKDIDQANGLIESLLKVNAND